MTPGATHHTTRVLVEGPGAHDGGPGRHCSGRARRSGFGLAGAVLAASAAISAGTVGLPAASASTLAAKDGASKQVLKIITWVNPPTVTAINAIDAKFEKKYPNITVDYHSVADISGPYLTLLETSVDSSSADIVSEDVQVQPLPPVPTRSDESLWQYWTTSGVFLPLNGQSFLAHYTPASRALNTYDGKVYGVTEESYQEGVFYNKADFAKYHLSVPTTYNAFLKVCEVLASHHVTPLYVGLGAVGASYLQFIYYELMGELWAPHVPSQNLAKALEDGATKWTSPYDIQALNEEKAIGKYLEPGYTGVSWESMPGAFARNDAAMLLDGSWDMPSVHAANPSIKVGFFPLPGSNDPALNTDSLDPNLGFAIVKKAPDTAAALKWLAFVAEPQNYETFVDTQGGSSTEIGGHYTGFTSGVLGSWDGKGMLLNNVFPALPAVGAYYDEAANWADLQLEVLQGSMSAKAAAAEYQKGWKTS